MRDEDYQLVEHPRLELHIHVATKFVQVIIATRMAMSMLKNLIIVAGMLITCMLIMVGAIFLLSLTLIMVLAVLQFGSLVGLTLVGPLLGAWRGRSLAAAGVKGDDSGC